MVDQYHDDVPSASNSILDDVSDMDEMFGFYKACFEQIAKGWSDSDATALRVYVPEAYGRSIVTYNGASTAYTVKLSGSKYWCKDKMSRWSSELTTTAIGTPSASTFYYLYLDYSAITHNTLITNSELIWSSTAPSFDHGYKQWLNGDDRCIFAVRTNSGPTNINTFYHDGGDLVMWGTAVTDLSNNNVTTSWESHTLTLPGFCTKAMLAFSTYDDGATTKILKTRPTGSPGNGIYVSGAVKQSFSERAMTLAPAFVNSSQSIDIQMSAGDAEVTIYNQGFYLPGGM